MRYRLTVLIFVFTILLQPSFATAEPVRFAVLPIHNEQSDTQRAIYSPEILSFY